MNTNVFGFVRLKHNRVKRLRNQSARCLFILDLTKDQYSPIEAVRNTPSGAAKRNIQFAYELYNGRGFEHWTTYRSGA